MIQIDEAGWDSLIGGATVGVYRPQTAAFAVETVAPRFFQGVAFDDEAYLDEAVEATRRCFRRLVVPREARVEVSTSHLLSRVRERLSTAGYDWCPAEIEGALRTRLERAFWRHLCQLGFRVDYEEYVDPTRRGLVWRRQVAWLKGGDARATTPDPARAASCKTGREAYKLWAEHPYSLARKRRGAWRRETATIGRGNAW